MSKKSSGLFSGTKGSLSKTSGKTKAVAMNYNSVGSKDFKIVKKVNTIDKDSHPKIPTKGKPNSVTKIVYNGKVDQERYYDENGDVYLDIDYTNHGNSKEHPIVPHQHSWIKDDNGNHQRKRYDKINN